MLKITITFLIISNLCQCQIMKIGGLFDNTTNESVEKIFKIATEYSNKEIIRRHFHRRLEPVTEIVPENNEFVVSKKLCRLLKSRIIGVIGPQSSLSAHHVQSVCDSKEMPYISTVKDATLKLPTVNIHPEPMILQKVFVDLVKSLEWEKFTILYENANNLATLSDLLKIYDNSGHTVTVRHLIKTETNSYRHILRRIYVSEEKNIIIDCPINILREVLKEAQQVGLMSDRHNFIITSMDLHTIDLEPFQYSGTNITGVRLFDPLDKNYQNLSNYWVMEYKKNRTRLPIDLHPNNLSTETALTFDSVILFATALNKLKGSIQLKPIVLNCGDDNRWKNGDSLINYLKATEVRGLTRDIKIDSKGHRSDFLIDIIELGSSGIRKIGEWNSTVGLNISRPIVTKLSQIADSPLRDKTLRVITAISPPHGMLKISLDQLYDNDRFEGFGMDLIKDLSLKYGFNYTFLIQEDGDYGTNDSGQWTGMMKELLENRADLAITDLTITEKREQIVDFTLPFMYLGISILFRKPRKEKPSVLAFLLPFSNFVWLLVGLVYLSVSAGLFLLGRFSSKEWFNPNPCNNQPTYLRNQLKFPNCLWFTLGVLMKQGSALIPKALSTRAIASMWGFFTVIMGSTYTASLTAFLTVSQNFTPIHDVYELAQLNGEIKYGAKRGGSTLNFFRDVNHTTFNKMYKYMMDHEELLPATNEEGVERVKNDNYAFIMESTTIEYIVERECELAQVGGLLDSKGYGIAMRKNSPYRDTLSEAVLILQEEGRLRDLKTKWWKNKRTGQCMKASKELTANHLTMDNFKGVFTVLVIGCTFAISYGCGESLYFAKKRSKRYGTTVREELIKELKFMISFRKIKKRKCAHFFCSRRPSLCRGSPRPQ